MPVYSNLSETVGKTPLIELGRLADKLKLDCRLLGKMESRNPCGSVKDRIAVAMIRDAEERGDLKPGSRIVSATSGNTGIALASAAAAAGYGITICMPESMSRERVALLRMLGAEVILTRGALMGSAVDKADEILAKDPSSIRLRQFLNPANPEMHRKTTAVEIWEDCEGQVDAFICGVGTGGTISGVGAYLKGQRDTVQIVAVEPETCAVLSGKPPGPHYIQGIGAGFVPEVLNRDVIDEVLTVSDKESMKMAVQLARSEGILAGVSSGANVAAAAKYAAKHDVSGKTLVIMLCDTGERYLSTALADQAMI